MISFKAVSVNLKTSPTVGCLEGKVVGDKLEALSEREVAIDLLEGLVVGEIEAFSVDLKTSPTVGCLEGKVVGDKLEALSEGEVEIELLEGLIVGEMEVSSFGK
jgi:hypothetical protein